MKEYVLFPKQEETYEECFNKLKEVSEAYDLNFEWGKDHMDDYCNNCGSRHSKEIDLVRVVVLGKEAEIDRYAEDMVKMFGIGFSLCVD